MDGIITMVAQHAPQINVDECASPRWSASSVSSVNLMPDPRHFSAPWTDSGPRRIAQKLTSLSSLTGETSNKTESRPSRTFCRLVMLSAGDLLFEQGCLVIVHAPLVSFTGAVRVFVESGFFGIIYRMSLSRGKQLSRTFSFLFMTFALEICWQWGDKGKKVCTFVGTFQWIFFL